MNWCEKLKVTKNVYRRDIYWNWPCRTRLWRPGNHDPQMTSSSILIIQPEMWKNESDSEPASFLTLELGLVNFSCKRISSKLSRVHKPKISRWIVNSLIFSTLQQDSNDGWDQEDHGSNRCELWGRLPSREESDCGLVPDMREMSVLVLYFSRICKWRGTLF